MPFCQYPSLREFYLLYNVVSHILTYVRMCAIGALANSTPIRLLILIRDAPKKRWKMTGRPDKTGKRTQPEIGHKPSKYAVVPFGAYL